MKAKFLSFLIFACASTLWADHTIVECSSVQTDPYPFNFMILHDSTTERAQILLSRRSDKDILSAGPLVYALLGGEAHAMHERGILEVFFRDDSTTNWNDPALANQCFVYKDLGHSIRIEKINENPLELKGYYNRTPKIDVRPGSNCSLPHLGKPDEVLLTCTLF